MQANPLQMFLPYLLVGVVFYFLVFRPQQKQRKTHDTMLRSLRKGDNIVTAGGIIGEVLHIAQQTKDGAAVVSMEDRVTIKSGETRLLIERGRISRVTRETSPADAKA